MQSDNTYYEVVYERQVTYPKTGWVRLDNFGCNTAADLASLLGVFKSKGTIEDCNTATEAGMYNVGNNASHSPASKYGCLVVFTAAGAIGAQVMLFGDAIYFRRCDIPGSITFTGNWVQVV